MYKRILVIGDIHGEWDKFRSLYQNIRFNPPEDLLVFLGDYVDRGPKSLETLAWMRRRRNHPHIVMLRGNHDQMMLDYYTDKETQKTMGGAFVARDFGGSWMRNGGGATDRALRAFARKAGAGGRVTEQEAMDAFLRFVGGLRLWFRIEAGGKTFVFCHAGIRPGVPMEEQKPTDLLWIRKDFIDGYTGDPAAGDPVVVAGHTRAQIINGGSAPIIRKNMMLLDTGACYGGPLSCVDVLSGEVWRSDGD